MILSSKQNLSPPFFNEEGWKKDKHLRLGDALDRSRPVPVRLAGHDDGLSATGCCGTSTIGVVVHPQAHGDDFGFHFANSREHVGV